MSATLVCIPHREDEDAMSEEIVAESPPEKLSIDEERQRQNVRIFVQRLAEVRTWLAECLGEENVPESPMELEESLRCGVLLAKLAHFFAPELVPNEKIFDLNQSRLADHGLHYRHSDNTNLWRQACIAHKLREIILPDPSDVYAGRNVRTIFALIALAKRLHQVGKAPPIRDHTTQVEITEEEYKAIGERIEEEEMLISEVPYLDETPPSTTTDSFIEYYDDEDATSPFYDAEAVRQDAMQEEVSTHINSSLVPDSKLAKTVQELDTEVAHELLLNEKPSLAALRLLIDKLDDPAAVFYHNEQDLEQRKAELKTTVESNSAMRVQLGEIEDYICLIVANVRNLKEKADKKDEKQRKKEIERAVNFSHSINHFFGDETAQTKDSLCGDGYAASQVSVLSQQTLDRIAVDAQLAPDCMMEVKSICLELLKMRVSGDTIEELMTATHVHDTSTEITAPSGEIQDKQSYLQQELAEFVKSDTLNDTDGHAELLSMLIEDVRAEARRQQDYVDNCEHIERLKADAKKEANELMMRIECYGKYKERCLERMAGGAPDINLDTLNKKAGKLLNKLVGHKRKKLKPIELDADQMIRKKVLHLQDESTPKEVEHYHVLITPNVDEPGSFTVEARHNKETRKTRTYTFEELLRLEQENVHRLEVDGSLAFDCVGLRRFLNRKYYLRNFV